MLSLDSQHREEPFAAIKVQITTILNHLGGGPPKKQLTYHLVPRYQVVKRGGPLKKICLPLSTWVLTGQGVVVPPLIWILTT